MLGIACIALCGVVNVKGAPGDATDQILGTQKDCVTPRDDLEVTSSIKLCPGVYPLDDKNNDGLLKIMANDVVLDCDGAEIVGDNSGTAVFTKGARNVVVKNCHLSDFDILVNATEAIGARIVNNELEHYTRYAVLASGRGVLIKDNSIRFSVHRLYGDGSYPDGHGINVYSLGETFILDNTLEDSDSSVGMGMYISGDGVETSGNVVRNYTHGMLFWALSNSSIRNNLLISRRNITGFFSAHCGIEVGTSRESATISNIEIANNEIYTPNNENGITIFGGSRNVSIRGNLIFVHRVGIGCFGKTFPGGGKSDCAQTVIEGNRINQCQYGFELRDARDNFLERNVVDCEFAFQSVAGEPVQRNVFVDNRFRVGGFGERVGFEGDNRFSMDTTSYRMNAAGGYVYGGNDWGNLCEELDADADDINDRPCAIDSSRGLKDKFPIKGF